MRIFFLLASLCFSTGVLTRILIPSVYFYIAFSIAVLFFLRKRWWYLTLFVLLGFIVSQRMDFKGVEVVGDVSADSKAVVSNLRIWTGREWRRIPGSFRVKGVNFGEGVYCLGDLRRVVDHPEYEFVGSCYEFPKMGFFSGVIAFFKSKVRDFSRSVGIISPRISGMLLSKKDEEVYKSGLTPFFAVSGFHVGLVFWISTILMSYFTSKRWLLDILSLIPPLLFIVSIGLTPSAVRAFSMIALHVFFKVLDYPVHPLNILGMSALISLLNDPYLVLSPSFLMSYSATAGILMGLERGNARTLTIPFYAFFSSLPFSVLFFGSFHVLTPVLSFLMLPLASVGVLAGSISLMLYTVGLEGLSVLVMRGSKPVEILIEGVLKLGAKVPSVSFQGIVGVISSLVISILVLRVILSRSKGWLKRSPRDTV